MSNFDLSKSFDDNFDLFMKGIDKSKNRLVTITDKKGVVRKVWKHIETGSKVDAGKNAGKTYSKTGKRHTSHSGFNSGDEITFEANGQSMKGIFRHVNESSHSTVAVIRGENGKLYERGLSRIQKVTKSSDAKFDGWIRNNRGQFEVVDRKNGKMVVAYSKKEEAEKTLNGINKSKNYEDTIKELKTMEGYGKFIREDKPKLDIGIVENLKEVSKKPLKTSGKNQGTTVLDYSKQKWEKGDTVSFTDSDGKDKIGKVIKVDRDINTTTIKLQSGITKTVSNKKINIK